MWEGNIMTKKDEEKTQIESALKEIKKGEEESAATAIATTRRSRKNTNVSGTLTKPTLKFPRLLKTLLIVLPLIAILVVGVWLYLKSTSEEGNIVFVEEIREIAKFATAEANLKVTFEEEDNNLFGNDIWLDLPGTKRVVKCIVPATVMAGVDLEEVTDDDIKVNEDTKEVEIVLPRATLLHEPAIINKDVEFYTDKGLFSGKVALEEQPELLAKAQEKLKERAIQSGVLETAEKSAEKALKKLLNKDGYDVKVTFK